MKKLLTILLLLIFSITYIPIVEASPRGYSGKRTTHVRGYNRKGKYVRPHSKHTYSSRPKRSSSSSRRRRH